MSSADLLPLLLLMPVVDWTATGLLILLAFRKPRISVLTERTFAAIGLSIVTTIYALVALNTELHFPVLNAETAKVAVRLAIVFLGGGPLAWLYVYWRYRW